MASMDEIKIHGYRVLGIESLSQCQICGRNDLEKVVVIESFDIDGGGIQILRAGTTCAARKLNKKRAANNAGRTHTTGARLLAEARRMEQARQEKLTWATKWARETIERFEAMPTGRECLIAYAEANPSVPIEEVSKSYWDFYFELKAMLRGDWATTRFAEWAPPPAA